MPSKKKAPAKGKAKARTGTQRAATRSASAQQLAANLMHIQVLTICFTILCIVFALEAAWQYCR
jgi:CHASE3 domain sensor protein